MTLSISQGLDAVDELIGHRMESAGKLSPMLRRVHRFHRANPQVLDFLISELYADRESGWKRASLGSLWHYARWVLTRKQRVPGESFLMANNIFPYYGRVIVILHPELNGFYAMARSAADTDFGTALESMPKSAVKGYVRRLLWADGSRIEQGWRPSAPHVTRPVARRDRVKR